MAHWVPCEARQDDLAWQAPTRTARPNDFMSPLVDYSSDSDSPTASDADDRDGPALKRQRLHNAVDASDKDDGDTPRDRSHTKASAKSSLPTLPSSFHSLYATNVRTTTSDDPQLHGGRKRQVAHKEGNWPTHVYLECKLRN